MKPTVHRMRRPRFVRKHVPSEREGWRQTVYRIVFEAETRPGRLFDALLFIAILASLIAVAVESTPYGQSHPLLFTVLEWGFTVLFTIEYIARLSCLNHPRHYALSFYGIIDLIAVLPTYLGLFLEGSPSLVVIRTLRLLRVFRIFKLSRFLGEADGLIRALKASRYKIAVFLEVVAIIVAIVGTLMYLIESKAGSGFDTIPKSMYWAVVTMTTVGYGDIAPKTSLGQAIAALLMIAGYAIIAVPTGIVSAEIVRQPTPEEESTRVCPECALEGHDPAANYCRRCGDELPTVEPEAGDGGGA